MRLTSPSHRQTGVVAATILQLSDLHLPSRIGEPVFGRDADQRLAAVLEAWRASGQVADLVLLTGDITDEGDMTAALRAARTVSALGLPMLALPGNHDRSDSLAAAFGTNDRAELDGWRVVVFDTTIPGEVHGALDVPGALARLDALDDRPTLVALHHPPLSRSTGAQFRLEGAAELLEGLGERGHVRAVVAGHLHDAVELAGPRGLPVLGGPAVVIGITHDGDEMTIDPHAPTGARMVRLGDDGSVTSHVLVA